MDHNYIYIMASYHVLKLAKFCVRTHLVVVGQYYRKKCGCFFFLLLFSTYNECITLHTHIERIKYKIMYL